MSGLPLSRMRLYDANANWYVVSAGVMLFGIVLAVGASVLLIDAVPIIFLPGVCMLIVGGMLALTVRGMPRRTQAGALEAARWRAFRSHLAETLRAHKPELALPPQYLAYAVAFGLDTEFVRHLEQVGAPPPRWYRGGVGPVIVVPGGWHGRAGRYTSIGSRRGLPGGGVATPVAPPDPQGWSDALAALHRRECAKTPCT